MKKAACLTFICLTFFTSYSSGAETQSTSEKLKKENIQQWKEYEVMIGKAYVDTLIKNAENLYAQCLSDQNMTEETYKECKKLPMDVVTHNIVRLQSKNPRVLAYYIAQVKNSSILPPLASSTEEDMITDASQCYAANGEWKLQESTQKKAQRIKAELQKLKSSSSQSHRSYYKDYHML